MSTYGVFYDINNLNAGDIKALFTSGNGTWWIAWSTAYNKIRSKGSFELGDDESPNEFRELIEWVTPRSPWVCSDFEIVHIMAGILMQLKVDSKYYSDWQNHLEVPYTDKIIAFYKWMQDHEDHWVMRSC